MGTLLSALFLTLADWAARVTDEGKVASIVEILKQTNEIIEDMPFIEGNSSTGHKTTIRSGLPSVAWRMLNYGVPNSKSKTVTVVDATGMLEAYAEVDKELADLNGNTAEFRLSEDIAFIEAMNQEVAATIFYGNTATHPERFLGLSPRYSSLSAHNAENIIDAGGTGSDNTSVWLVCWGANTIHGIFPKGSNAGLQQRDLGEQTLFDENNNKYQGYRSHYQWKLGLCLRDWRYVVRVANIDVTKLTKNAASGADLVDLLIQAIETVPNLNLGRAVFYGNKTITSYLRRQIKNTSNVHLTLDQVEGRKVMSFDGIPFKKVHALLNTEEAVV